MINRCLRTRKSVNFTTEAATPSSPAMEDTEGDLTKYLQPSISESPALRSESPATMSTDDDFMTLLQPMEPKENVEAVEKEDEDDLFSKYLQPSETGVLLIRKVT